MFEKEVQEATKALIKAGLPVSATVGYKIPQVANKTQIDLLGTEVNTTLTINNDSVDLNLKGNAGDKAKESFNKVKKEPRFNQAVNSIH